MHSLVVQTSVPPSYSPPQWYRSFFRCFLLCPNITELTVHRDLGVSEDFLWRLTLFNKLQKGHFLIQPRLTKVRVIS